MSNSINSTQSGPVVADAAAENINLEERRATGIERLYEGKGAIDFVGRSKLWYLSLIHI